MQDYKLVVRGLTAGRTLLNTDGGVAFQNFSEFFSELNTKYLEQGYEIQSVDNLRVIPEDRELGTPLTYEFAYHLVKTVDTEPKAKK